MFSTGNAPALGRHRARRGIDDSVRADTLPYAHTAPRGLVLRTSRANGPAARPRAGSPASAQGARLLAQAEALDQAFIGLGVPALEVVEQFAAAADHLEQAAPGMVILDVCLEMLG